jgi:hypothetical protein
MMNESEWPEERDALGGKPVTPIDEDLASRCESGRDGLTPKETADCAGQELSELYENEEDGGS